MTVYKEFTAKIVIIKIKKTFKLKVDIDA